MPFPDFTECTRQLRLKEQPSLAFDLVFLSITFELVFLSQSQEQQQPQQQQQWYCTLLPTSLSSLVF